MTGGARIRAFAARETGPRGGYTSLFLLAASTMRGRDVVSPFDDPQVPLIRDLNLLDAPLGIFLGEEVVFIDDTSFSRSTHGSNMYLSYLGLFLRTCQF